MKTKLRETYNCDFCKKLYLRKNAAEFHELICRNNPVNERPCYFCEHLEKKDIIVTDGYYYDGSEIERNLSLFHCKAKNLFLHTPKVEHKKNAFDLGDEANEPMPKMCEIYKTTNLF